MLQSKAVKLHLETTPSRRAQLSLRALHVEIILYLKNNTTERYHSSVISAHGSPTFQVIKAEKSNSLGSVRYYEMN